MPTYFIEGPSASAEATYGAIKGALLLTIVHRSTPLLCTQPPDRPNTPIHESINHRAGGDELCAKVTYLGAGGLELFVNKRLTVGFLAQNHTEADIGACTREPAPTVSLNC